MSLKVMSLVMYFLSNVVVSLVYFKICPFTVVTNLCFFLSSILFTSKARAAKSCTTKLFFQILKLGTQNLGEKCSSLFRWSVAVIEKKVLKTFFSVIGYFKLECSFMASSFRTVYYLRDKTCV
jgi:hypothetical protein